MERRVAIFPTPVYVTTIPDAAALNGDLRGTIAAHRRSASGVSKSNIGGWQSDIDMLAWGGRAAATLAEHAVAICRQITASAAVPPRSTIWTPELWANVNVCGDSNQSHWHPGSYLSFVYYVDDGYAGSTNKALGGELVFIDPRMPVIRMRAPNLRHRAPNGRTEEQETWIRPYSGLLIGFPSFLSHSVRPYLGLATRMSIAINVLAKEAE